MGHGRNLRRGFVEDDTPELQPGQSLGRVSELRGKGIVAVVVPGEAELLPALAFLPPRFRNVLFLRRGSYVLLSPLGATDVLQKVTWSIETLLRPEDIKYMRKDGTWPSLFDSTVNITRPVVEVESKTIVEDRFDGYNNEEE